MSTPEPAAPYRTLPAAHLADPTAPLRWLLADLFLAGAPKTGKSFFALEIAVASGTPAAGRFPVAAPGPVLLLAAEDPPAVVVQRLAALAAARAHAFATLPVDVIVEPGVRLPEGLDRLGATVAHHQPRLLILDPLIRLHRANENSAPEMAGILDGLRALARAADCASTIRARRPPAARPASAFGGLLSHFNESGMPSRRICVLTEYLGTLYYVAAEIEGLGLSCHVLNGGMNAEDRHRSLRLFSTTEGILLATNAVMTESVTAAVTRSHRSRGTVFNSGPRRAVDGHGGGAPQVGRG